MTKQEIEKAKRLAKFYTNLAKKGAGIKKQSVISDAWCEDAFGPNMASDIQRYMVKEAPPKKAHPEKVWLFKVKKTENFFRLVTNPDSAERYIALGHDLMAYIPEPGNK
jgi:hypothetical protein